MENESKLAGADAYDLAILLIALDALSVELVALELELIEALSKLKRSEIKKSPTSDQVNARNKTKQNKTKHPTWSSIENDIPDSRFRRKFRMDKNKIKGLECKNSGTTSLCRIV